jgi:hypothetical protein
VINSATDDEEIEGIIGGLSFGKRAMLYSALHYTESQLPEPGSSEQRKGNNCARCAFSVCFFYEGRTMTVTNNALKARPAALFRELVAQDHRDG